MRNKLILLLCCVVTIAGCIHPPAYAAVDYEFVSGADTLVKFGKYTSYDEAISPNPATENLRRNKDAAAFAPPYGIYSGYIPTDPSSLYHDNARSGGTAGIPGGSIGESWNTGTSYVGSGESIVGNIGSTSPYGASQVEISTGSLPATSVYESPTYLTEPLFYDDGSIGSLSISKLNRIIKVYEGESLESMSRGIGHFEGTSAWDGLVGLAGHNRGAAPYFAFVKDLAIGDSLIYSTPYGTRTYKVFNKTKIGETDYSGLAWTAENTLSLITCIANEPSYRWLVQAREVNTD